MDISPEQQTLRTWERGHGVSLIDGDPLPPPSSVYAVRDHHGRVWVREIFAWRRPGIVGFLRMGQYRSWRELLDCGPLTEVPRESKCDA